MINNYLIRKIIENNLYKCTAYTEAWMRKVLSCVENQPIKIVSLYYTF